MENMTAQEKYDMIINGLNARKNVYISTSLRSWKITPMVKEKWDSRGLELFKVKNNSLYMANGKKFVCIDYCAITVTSMQLG
jgi:D-lyxose ketol-isomerase